MKKMIFILALFMVVAGCSESSDKSDSTNPVLSNDGLFNNGSINNGQFVSGNGSNVITPSVPGVTPDSYGENKVFPISEIELGFEVNSGGSVVSDGEMRLQQNVGGLNCEIPKGVYIFATNSPGSQTSSVHNYENVIYQATGPVSFTAKLIKSLSLQTSKGDWVMYASLVVQSVNGSSCSIPLSFGMP